MCCVSFLLPFCFATLAVASYFEVSTSGIWDGNDGPWSSFQFLIGNPQQISRLLPSTSSSCLMPLSALDCGIAGSVSCSIARNSRYDAKSSNTWTPLGNNWYLPLYALPPGDSPVAFNGSSRWGVDDLFLQHDMPVLNSTFVSDMYNFTEYSTGMFGVFGNPISLGGVLYPSLLGALRAHGVIQSNSWSYTAGAFGRNQSGSFIFGGYDQERFDPSSSITASRNLSEISRAYATQLYVSLQGITDDANPIARLMSPHQTVNMKINTDVPQIWMPSDVCEQFTKAYNLTWNSSSNLYILDPDTAASLRQRQSPLSFKIAPNAADTDKAIAIKIPWSFLVMNITIEDRERPYIPIKCTTKVKEFTLGRAFLQAAYLTVNFDGNTFTMSQALYPGSNSSGNVTTIWTREQTSPQTSPSKATIAGVVTGALAIILILVTCYLVWRRARKTNATSRNPLSTRFKPELAATPVEDPPAYRRRHSSNVTTRSEIDGVSTMVTTRLDTHLDTLPEANESHDKITNRSPVELEAGPVQVSELYGGFDGIEMRAGDSPREGYLDFVAYHDHELGGVEEPVSPLHEAEVKRSTSTNRRLSRTDL